MTLPPFDRDAARALIKEKADAPFSAFDTADRAHRRADRQLHAEAVSRCAEVDRDYTAIHPHQEELLEIAMGMGHRPIVERLAGKIAGRRPAKKVTKDLLARAKAFLSGPA